MPWFDRLGREPASQQLPGSPGRATISDRADPPTKPEAAPAEHPAAGRRLPALDVLRGIAILGTLASNIWIFTSVIGLSAGARSTESGTSLLAEVPSWLPNGKFLGLLTIMFGIGLEIQRQAAVRAGKKWPGKYPLRALLLFADGVLNYIFVVQFDVLRAYAVVGLIVAFLLLANEKVQWWLIGMFLTAHIAMMAWPAVRFDDRALSADEVTRPDGLRDSASRWSADPAELDGGWWDSVVFNARSLEDGFVLGSEFITILLMGGGLFLGFGVALPVDYLLARTSVLPALSGFSRYGAAAVVALGILALVGEYYCRRQRVGLAGRLLSYVGRMALSCYLLQNILGVLAERLLFNRPVFRDLDPLLCTYGAFIVISALLVLFSWACLRRFPRGPFELLWNWSYRKLARE